MRRKVILSLLVLLSFQYGHALTANAKKLIDFETQSNAVAQRDNNAMLMPHFEIPLSMLETDFAERLSPLIRKQLVFTKNKQKMVRWILNPEDTKWSNEVVEYFKTKGLILEKKYYFTGYKTASRSYIVEDPQNTVQFSVKSSTNVTGGLWADKKQPIGEAIDSRLNADFLAEIQEKLKFKNIVIMDEPAIIKLADIDQAVVIRDIAGLNSIEKEYIYVPGFSVLHEKMGKEIAEENGSTNPTEFWEEHYIKSVGRALGEFAARTGMQFDSPHSQNFLVELDSNYKPTGRIVFRDLADLYVNRTFMNVIHSEYENYNKNFKQKENILNLIAAGFGPLHGNKFPSWITEGTYDRWNNVFFTEFEKTLSAESGLAVSDFKNSVGRRDMNYFGNTYTISKSNEANSRIDNFWKNMKMSQTPLGQLNCSYLFKVK